MTNAYIAVDFGGGSGVDGCFHTWKYVAYGRSSSFSESASLDLGNHLYWDFLVLFDEMKQGPKKAVQKGYFVRTIGIDTFVDFGLIDER